MCVTQMYKLFWIQYVAVFGLCYILIKEKLVLRRVCLQVQLRLLFYYAMLTHFKVCQSPNMFRVRRVIALLKNYKYVNLSCLLLCVFCHFETDARDNRVVKMSDIEDDSEIYFSVKVSIN